MMRHYERAHRDNIPRRSKTPVTQWEEGRELIDLRTLGDSVAERHFVIEDVIDESTGVSLLNGRFVEVHEGLSVRFTSEEVPAGASMIVRLSSPPLILELEIQLTSTAIAMAPTEENVELAKIHTAETNATMFVTNTLDEDVKVTWTYYRLEQEQCCFLMKIFIFLG